MPDIADPERPSDPTIALIRDGTRALLGARLDRLVLYGSRARGDARPESDYDVMVFLKNYQGLWQELQPLGQLAIEIFDRTGAVVNFLPARSEDYGRRTGFMHEVRSEGRAV